MKYLKTVQINFTGISCAIYQKRKRDKNSLILLYWGDTICEHFTIANLRFIFPHFQLTFSSSGCGLRQ